MKLDIVKIGNSRGVRLPKALLEQAGITDRVEVEVVDDKIIMTRARRPREGWAEAFAEAVAKYGPPEPLFPDDMTNKFDREQWVWESPLDPIDDSKSSS